jgi:hypothetical protein
MSGDESDGERSAKVVACGIIRGGSEELEGKSGM